MITKMIVIAMMMKMSGPISPFSSGISKKIVPFVKFWNRKSICFIAMNCFPGKFLRWNQVLEANALEASLFRIKVFSLRLDNIGEELHHTIISLWLISDSSHIELCYQLIYKISNKRIFNITKILVETALDKWRQLMSVMKQSGGKT